MDFSRKCATMPTVFVIGEDWTLRSLVRAELREHGIEAMGMESLDDAALVVGAGTVPSAVVLDTTPPGGDPAALEFLSRSVPVLVVTSPGVPAPAWAAAVLSKPVQVGEIVAGVENLLKGLAA
jgi:DNA-binding response OmpR family regulator